MEVSRARALTWRLRRQHLLTGAPSAADVVHRLCAVPAWSGNADLAVRRRLRRADPSALTRVLHDGELMRTYAFRGATHLITPADAAACMAVRGAGSPWLRRSWSGHYDLTAADWPALGQAVREALADGPLTRAHLVQAVTGHARFRHLRAGLCDPSHTLLKALAWQGWLCFGPTSGGQPTYQGPVSNPRWPGLPDLDVAGTTAVLAYLSGYGPARVENIQHWLVSGLSAGRARLDRWLGALVGARVVEVEVDGRPALHLREHLAALAEQESTAAVTLLPGHDQWVLGPGTAEQSIVPAAHRASVTRGANLVLRGGTVTGTWTLTDDTLVVTCPPGPAAPTASELQQESRQLAGLLGRAVEVETLTP